MIFFTADTHFWHRGRRGGVIKYCNRPFLDAHGNPDIRKMNDVSTDNWNAVVKPGDTIYHLGDLSMTGTKATEAILKRLNGKKYLVIGDHDKSAVKCLKYFEDIADTMFISVNGQEIYLSHYCHKTWRKSHFGSWHLFGHSHGGLNEYAAGEGKLLDVGVDSHDFRPWSFEEIQKVMATRPDNFNLVKGR